jgi:predicted acyltransferase
MFIILGVEELAGALGKAHPAGWTRVFAEQLDHAAWEGFHFLDLIFPLFVFLSGVSLVFSADKSIERRGRAATMGKFISRGVLLTLLGVIYYGGISHGWGEVRWVGVLQRIAFCSMMGGLLYCTLGWRARAGVAIGLLAGYWAVLSFIPGSGGVRGDFAEGPEHNLANWVDFVYLPGKKWDKTHDPEGILSTIPAVASCLLGVFCGEYLKKHPAPGGRKAAVLIGLGALLAALGWAWGLQFPVIKKLWTSSYVLVAGGYSMMLLGAFYGLIDVKGWRWWAWAWVWIGGNAILLYMGRHLVRWEALSESLVGGPVSDAAAPWGPVIVPAVALLLNVLLARFLYKRGVFLRI